MWRSNRLVLVGLMFILCVSIVTTQIGEMKIFVPKSPEELTLDVLSCLSQVKSAQSRRTNYTLKWYKDGNEFYRYTSKNTDNPIEVFDVAGVRVNKALSDDRKVYLDEVTQQSPGKYKCEITTEGPNPETQFKEETMGIRSYSEKGDRYDCLSWYFDNGKSALAACYFIINGTNVFGNPWNFNWYKDDQLFYSYTPEGIHSPHVPGVHLDPQQTSKNTIVLHHVSNKTAGNYVMELTLPPTASHEIPKKYRHGFDFKYRP